MTERVKPTEGALTTGAGPVEGKPAPAVAPTTPSGVYTPGEANYLVKEAFTSLRRLEGIITEHLPEHASAARLDVATAIIALPPKTPLEFSDYERRYSITIESRSIRRLGDPTRTATAELSSDDVPELLGVIADQQAKLEKLQAQGLSPKDWENLCKILEANLVRGENGEALLQKVRTIKEENNR
jgi:hypothetical protein